MVRKGATAEASKTKRKTVKKARPKAKVVTRAFIDCSVPVDDGIFDLEHFEQYVASKFKVSGKAGKLGDVVRFFKEGSKLYCRADGLKYRKRYLKYLTKKYLKKQELRDWLHIVSTGNRKENKGYQIKYLPISQEGAPGAQGEETELNVPQPQED